MPFNIKDFVHANKKILTWVLFFSLLFVLRHLFSLVFMTFILCFIFNNLIEWLIDKTRWPRWLWTVAVYLVFIAVVSLLISLIGPKLGSESTIFIKQMPQMFDNLISYLDKLAEEQPTMAPFLSRAKDMISLEKIAGLNMTAIMNSVMFFFNQVTSFTSFFLLSILFSFLILFDFTTLRAKTIMLRQTRLHDIYEAVADSVAQFALTVGAAFQAQIMIASLNTCLTALGLWGLGINHIALLCVIVFFCGLIPVLGVFISSAPILLLAFNSGGLKLVIGALTMIIIIHIIEAYILNPRIYSAVFKINPVLTLMILYIGHSMFGMWGMLLGIPVSVYIFRHIILGQGLQFRTKE